MIEASIHYSSDYLLEALNRYHQQGAVRFFFAAVKLAGLVVFISQTVLLAQKGFYASALLAALMVLVFLNLYRGVCWLARWSFQNRPYYDQRLALQLTPEQFYGRSERWEIRLPWTAFQKAVHFRDGFLLFQSPKVFNWIPLAALKNRAQAAELEALLRAKIPVHKIVQPCANSNERSS
jgi:hypothetical protein